MFIAGTWGSGSGYFSGRFWRFDDRVAETGTAANLVRYVQQLPLPYGVFSLSYRRPSISQYADRLYVAGGYTANLVIDEHERVSVQGIMPPVAAPSVTSGGAGTDVLLYLSFWDELTNEYSPLSAYTTVAEVPPYVWTNLPTHTPDEYMYPAGLVHIDNSPAEAYNCDIEGNIANTGKVVFLRPGDKLYDSETSKAVALIRLPVGPSASGDKFKVLNYPGTDVIYEHAGALPRQRSSHVVLWRSVAGALPRIVTKVRLGTTTVTESVPYTQLGEPHPGDFHRFPRCTMNTIYHDRQILAGDPLALDTVYLSAIGYPERNEGFQFRVRNGETVTALVGTRDYCLVLTSDSTYLLQGFTEDDMVLELVDNGIGAVGHLTNVVVNGYPYVTSRLGINMFNGSWHPVMKESAHAFSRHYSRTYDLYSISGPSRNGTVNNATFYQQGWMVNNTIEKSVQLFMGIGVGAGGSTSPSWFLPCDGTYTASRASLNDGHPLYSWVLGYEPVVPQAGGSFDQGDLSHDVLPTPYNQASAPNASGYTASAFLADDNGGGGMWFGDSNGNLYKESSFTYMNGLIMTPAYFFDSAGGYEREGKTLVKFWSFIDGLDWTVWVTGGDEWAGYLALGLDNADDLVATTIWPWPAGPSGAAAGSLYVDTAPADPASVVPIGNGELYETVYHRSVKSVHEHPLPDTVSGRMFTWIYVFNGAWRGVGGYYQPGPATRPGFTEVRSLG